VHCPEIFNTGGKTITKMVQNIDIAPTLLAVAGLKAPATMPGKSFISLLKGDSVQWRDKIFYEYYWEYDFPMTPTMFGVRSDQYKYIRYYGLWDTNELYDLEKDPDETTNLIGRPEYDAIIKKLAGELYDWQQQTGGMQIPLKRTIKNPYGDYRHPKNF
jgi:N-acetylglucosamine-6-sulfatase